LSKGTLPSRAINLVERQRIGALIGTPTSQTLSQIFAMEINIVGDPVAFD
jgi:hypothetical protein